ncbi:uncharacterized protein ACWYII_028414 [Salvelinus alpinus]
MGWSWALACWCALVLVCAFEDNRSLPDLLQREASFDIEDFLQREIQLEPEMTQREITLHLDKDFTPGVRPMAGPRSFGDSHPSILFPPGRPSPKNLQAICLHSSHCPWYPAYSLPRNGGGHFRR